ncbi:MAG: hypothetical protein WBA43_14965 [Elainellaceae cyanobacterium]|uniref:hypothetical protein n=1 Tax=Leptolyngbya sp. CCY15150 TaxID=2767772 RepID=UPI00194E1017|nr:hypothetical protein [Leptolyngbya sp. CCY15150]
MQIQVLAIAQPHRLKQRSLPRSRSSQSPERSPPPSPALGHSRPPHKHLLQR